jgi:hypothetical protein
MAGTGYLYYSASDGSSTTASSGDAIIRVNADGTGATTIASGFTNLIEAMALDATDNIMLVLDNTGFFAGSTTGNTIWSVNLSTGTATKIFTGTSLANSGTSLTLGTAIAYDPTDGKVYFTQSGILMRMGVDGSSPTAVTGSAISAAINGLTLDPADNLAFVVDATTADRDIFSVNLISGAVTKIYQNTSFIMGSGLAYNPVDGDVYFTQNSASSGSSPNLYKIPKNPGSTLSSGTLVASSVEGTSAAQISFDQADGLAYIRGITSGATTINQVNLSTGAVSTAVSPAGFTGLSVIFELCFCRGTLIRTPAGDVAVERLSVGDMVVTRHGEHRAITWIGVGRVLATRGCRNAATPVIVRKSALADNVPHADLRVTKGHSFFIDGVLIPIEFLVNHRSILWDDRAQEVELYHVELETHDVLLANGALAESYRDDGNRWLFHNAEPAWSLPPQEPCAPVLTGGAVVDAAWRRLLDRAGPRPGVPLTDDPDLHLLVDGDRLEAASQLGAYVFRLPPRPSSVRIVSRAAAPAELGLARDPRVLGVALRRIALRQGTRFRVIEAADALLDKGFHAFEPDNGLRWTDGDATVPTVLFDGFDDPTELVLHVGCATQYLLFGEVGALAAA